MAWNSSNPLSPYRAPTNLLPAIGFGMPGMGINPMQVNFVNSGIGLSPPISQGINSNLI